MQLSNVVKGLMLALPIVAVTACSSGNKGANQNANGTVSSVSLSSSAAAQLRQLQQTNTVFFGFDKYDISADFAQMLDGHAAFLRANPTYKVTIEGHTDERGTPEYNIALGERRANAVRAYLQGRGVSPAQISIVSYGKEKPAMLGHNEDAHAKNRRAIIVY